MALNDNKVLVAVIAGLALGISYYSRDEAKSQVPTKLEQRLEGEKIALPAYVIGTKKLGQKYPELQLVGANGYDCGNNGCKYNLYRAEGDMNLNICSRELPEL